MHVLSRRYALYLVAGLLALWSSGLEAAFDGTIHIRNNTETEILNPILTRGTYPSGSGGL